MESDLFCSSSILTPTAVYRRWHMKQGYINSSGHAIAPYLPPVHEPLWSTLRQGLTVPLADGSTPFLRLPTELRLQIYGYLTADDSRIHEAVENHFWAKKTKQQSSTTYAYLYRSPGRITKANAFKLDVIKLFHINHQIREELLDSCFSDRTFVLEASLYSRPVGGLQVLPPRLGMSAWIKKLLLITTLDSEKCQMKGMADLRPLQEMINLRELHIIFRATGPTSSSTDANNPIHAIFRCIPSRTKVSIGVDRWQQEEIQRELGHSVNYLFTDDVSSLSAYIRLNMDMHSLNSKKGVLSGSRVNHSECRFPICEERGVRCVNSLTPNILPSPGLSSAGCESDVIKYQCGCEVRTGDGGFFGHDCPKKRKLQDSVERTPATPKREKLREMERQEQRDFWKASLQQRTRRRWKSWGGQ